MPGESLVLKIADFGISRTVCGTDSGEKNITRERRGTSGYMAPEIELQEFGKPADIWGIGCIMLAIVVGEDKLRRWSRGIAGSSTLPELPQWPNQYEHLRPLLIQI